MFEQTKTPRFLTKSGAGQVVEVAELKSSPKASNSNFHYLASQTNVRLKKEETKPETSKRDDNEINMPLFTTDNISNN